MESDDLAVLEGSCCSWFEDEGGWPDWIEVV